MATMHTLSVLVENKPGVLTRVAGLFARRGFNITSLTVGETERPAVSRMTIIVDAEVAPFEQVTKQLNKLINVIKVVELERDDSVERQLMLIKVRADEARRAGVVQVVDLCRAHVVDVVSGPRVIGPPGQGGDEGCPRRHSGWDFRPPLHRRPAQRRVGVQGVARRGGAAPHREDRPGAAPSLRLDPG
jgi:acetolactate synthase-1/3 small subunit